MRTLFRFAFVVFLFTILFTGEPAFAETLGTYGVKSDCATNTTTYQTTLRYPSSVDQYTLTIQTDPAFVSKMASTRGGVDVSSPTPIYDLVVTASGVFSTCYTAKTASELSVTPPQTLPFQVSIVVNKTDVVVGPGQFTYSGQNDTSGQPIYQWKIPGWPNGIAPAEKLEKLITALSGGSGTVEIVVFGTADIPTHEVRAGASMGLCAALSGGSPHSVVYMRGKSMGVFASAIVMFADKVREDGFEKTQPFRKYSLREENPARRSSFAHFVDLTEHDDTTWAMLLNKFFIAANSRPKNISACGSKASQYFFLTDRPQGGLNYAPYGNGVAFISVPLVEIAMHEMGHSFAGLEDEYHSGFDLTLYHANCAPAETRPGFPPTDAIQTLLKKADRAPRNTDLTFIKRAYWDPYGDTIKGCSLNLQFRPSMRSLMNSNGFESSEFNVPSCVWILKAIHGTASVADWQECMAMDGLEKPIPRITENTNRFLPSPFFFSWLKEHLLAAVAISDNIKTEGEPAFVNLEYFSPDGKEIRSEVFENTGTETNPTWNQITPDASCQIAGGCTLPDLGLYKDKLTALKNAIAKAILTFQARHNATYKNAKGAEVLHGDSLTDGSLYLLLKMKKNLETNANGSLIDHAGLVKFYAYLKLLKGFVDPANTEVASRANDLTGFSYLFPPSPDKPTLIYIPGAGGEPAWRGAWPLLEKEAANFNIVGYTYDAVTVSTKEMADTLRAKFVADKLNAEETAILTLSMGSTILSQAILTDVLQNDNVFSNSHVVNTGLLPGGAANFLAHSEVLINTLVSVAPHAYPISSGVINVMNPANPVYTDIANYIVDIGAATKGISYIQANGDTHINPDIKIFPGQTKRNADYVENRDKTLRGMTSNLIYVTPPEVYDKNNPHINLLYAPEVKTKIDDLLKLLPPNKPRASIDTPEQHRVALLPATPSWRFKALQTLRAYFMPQAVLAQTSPNITSGPIMSGIVYPFFGSTVSSECAILREAMEDSMMIPQMDYQATANAVRDYLALTGQNCILATAINNLNESAKPFTLSITSFLPISETSATQVDTIHIRGVGFSQTNNSVIITSGQDAQKSTAIFANSPSGTSFNFTIPFIAPGSYTVSVKTPTSLASNFLDLNVQEPPPQNTTPLSPVLYGVSNTGSVPAGDKITVTGTDFTPDRAMVVLTSGTNEYVFLSSPITLADGTESLSFVLTPNVPPGDYVVTVVNSNLERSSNLEPVILTVAPTILSLSLGGTKQNSVTLTGVGFTGKDLVNLISPNENNSRLNIQTSIINNSTLEFILPDKMAVGTYTVTFENITGTSNNTPPIELILALPQRGGDPDNPLAFACTDGFQTIPQSSRGSQCVKISYGGGVDLQGNEWWYALNPGKANQLVKGPFTSGQECQSAASTEANPVSDCVNDRAQLPTPANPPPNPNPSDTKPYSAGFGLVPCGFDLNGDGKIQGYDIVAKPAGSTHYYQEECDFNALLILAKNIMDFLFIISASIAAICFAVAGIMYLTSGGNPGKAEQAKHIFVYTGIGFVFILGAWLFVSFIESSLLPTPQAVIDYSLLKRVN